ncbi:phage holin family protein [Furfurilactobacillus siliginis]|nr:phage holin family protein [Furfurilactobacillus siliginis]
MTHMLIWNELQKMEQMYMLHLFLAVMVADVGLGTVKGLLTKKMDSTAGTRGLVKHLTMLVTTLFGFFFADIAGMGNYASIFIVFGIIQYGNSCVENWCQMGLPFPRKWRTYLNKLKDDDGNLIDYPNVFKKGK